MSCAARFARFSKRAAIAALLAALAAGCGPRLDLGSDLLWTSLFEGNTFDEWTGDGDGAALAFPEGGNNRVEISSERVRHGSYAAKLTVEAAPGGEQGSAVLARAGEALPVEGYYSAWYWLPRSVSVSVNVGRYWVIFKFRQRNQDMVDELFDLDLINLDAGEMSLQLYDHRRGASVPLDVDGPVVPVGQWFQIEAYYRNAQDDTGRLTFWLDGRQIVELANQPMAPTPFVEWNACSIGADLTPSTAVIYVDDCAVSRSRVGPNGIIAD
jgi:hypothetical protein